MLVPTPRCLGVVFRIFLLVLPAGCADSNGTDPEPPRVAAISVSPGNATLTFLGEMMVFTASATDQYGAPYSGTLIWTSEAPSVFTVSSRGVVTAVSNGSGTLRAELDGVSGTATVRVAQIPFTLEGVSGGGQRGLPGTQLHEPVVTRALDAGGAPVSGAGVFFSPSAGSGSISPGSTASNADGLASALWTLGETLGTQTVTASLADGASAAFTATALQPNELADSVTVVSGDGQSALPGTGLRAPVVVRVVDQRGQAVPGATVLFAPAAGHGSADPDSTDTDYDGEAATTWTLGDKIGPQLLTASVADGPKARVVAMGAFGICDRTHQVREALVVATGASNCADVTSESLTQVVVLEFRNTGITALQVQDFAGLSGLRNLGLREHRLRDIPVGAFADLANLDELSLGGRELRTLPTGGFAGLQSLKILNLEGGGLTELPPGAFAGLTDLETLELNGNRLTDLRPGIFTGLTSLRQLYLSRNNLTELLPGVFASLPTLELLNLLDNGLFEVTSGTFSGLVNLSGLNLAYNQLAELPADLFAGLASLEHLGLGANHLTELPDDIFAGLQRLRTLSLDRNLLTQMPEAIVSRQIATLESLNLTGNRFTELQPGTFATVPNLAALWISDNQLSELPGDVFAEVQGLTSLDLGANRLERLPPQAFSGLVDLQSLNLKDNRLAELPTGIFSGLANLRWLHLSGNPGAPFALEVRLERTDTTDLTAPGPAKVAVRVAQGAPFDLEIGLSATGANLSPMATTISTGEIVSQTFDVTREAGTHGSVTVRIVPTPRVPDVLCIGNQLCYTGLIVAVGDPITLFR